MCYLTAKPIDCAAAIRPVPGLSSSRSIAKRLCWSLSGVGNDNIVMSCRSVSRLPSAFLSYGRDNEMKGSCSSYFLIKRLYLSKLRRGVASETITGGCEEKNVARLSRCGSVVANLVRYIQVNGKQYLPSHGMHLRSGPISRKHFR